MVEGQSSPPLQFWSVYNGSFNILLMFLVTCLSVMKIWKKKKIIQCTRGMWSKHTRYMAIETLLQAMLVTNSFPILQNHEKNPGPKFFNQDAYKKFQLEDICWNAALEFPFTYLIWLSDNSPWPFEWSKLRYCLDVKCLNFRQGGQFFWENAVGRSG
jgi:hypothetical protein